jgi:hypothetical protein
MFLVFGYMSVFKQSGFVAKMYHEDHDNHEKHEKNEKHGKYDKHDKHE